MSLGKKKIYILDYINSDRGYLSTENDYNYTIDEYLDSIEELFDDQLELIKHDLFETEKYFRDSENIAFEVKLDLDFKLEQYAKFLIYMHRKISKLNKKSNDIVKMLHLTYYKMNSQRNYLRYPKKFYLV